MSDKSPHSTFPPSSAPKTFTDVEIDTMEFRHAYRAYGGGSGPTTGSLVVITQQENGYCVCRKVTPLGLSGDRINLWSGCLEPDRPLADGYRDLAKQMREQRV